jgi:hypothetical protein
MLLNNLFQGGIVRYFMVGKGLPLDGVSQTNEQDPHITDNTGRNSTGRGYGQLSSRLLVRWSVYALLAVFCVYRLAVFAPLPLDTPGTLRPILYAVFKWFVGSATREQAFAQWSTYCSLLLWVPAVLAILHYGWRQGLLKLPRRAAQMLCSRWLFFTSIGVCLVLCRYPTLLQPELNPDEGAFIAAAFKLFYDPNFFHAADCATNGPLNIYALMLPAIFGISPDFASSRLLAIIIVFLCAFLFYRAIALLAPEELARLAVLPFVAAMAVVNNTELRHYSSEYVPLLLIATALYWSVRVLCHPARYQGPAFWLGMLACAAFFAKMQSVPVVLSLTMVALAYVYVSGSAGTRWRPVLLFVAGAMPLLLLNAILCLSAGVWKDFWISYVRSNIYYTDMGTGGFITNLRPFTEFLVSTYEVRFFLFTVLAVGVAYLVERRWRQRAMAEHDRLVLVTTVSAVLAAKVVLPSVDGWTIYTYFMLIALCLLPLYIAVLYSRQRLSLHPVSWLGFLSLLFSAATFYSIYKAHRPFLHYLLFLFLPLSTAMAWMLVRQAGSAPDQDSEKRQLSVSKPHRFGFVVLVLAFLFAYQSYIWNLQDNQLFNKAAADIRPAEGEFVRSVTSPGPTIFVWGWNVRPYLGSGRGTATRDLMVANGFRSYNMLVNPPEFNPTRKSLEIDNYYKKRIMHDLRANPPELFIDSISIASWFMHDRRYFGFKQIPELNQFVKDHYVAFTEFYEERFYLRRDLAARWGSVRSPRACAPGALTCFALPPGKTFDEVTFAAQKLPAIQMPAHALIEAEFTPIGVQTDVGTIFNNEAVPFSFRGFRFQSIGGDRYHLILGLGKTWAVSKPVLLPQGKPASVSLEFNGTDVHIRCNGVAVDDMHLASRMADTAGPVTLGSWIDGQCRFFGAVQFFQILDLDKAQ